MKFLERSEALEIICFKAPDVAECPGWGFPGQPGLCQDTVARGAGSGCGNRARLGAGSGFGLIKILERKGWRTTYQGLSAGAFPTSVPARWSLVARVRSSALKVPGPLAGLTAGHRTPKGQFPPKWAQTDLIPTHLSKDEVWKGWGHGAPAAVGIPLPGFSPTPRSSRGSGGPATF